MSEQTTLTNTLRLPCGVTLPNRLLKSAMTEGLADELDRPTAGHLTLYDRWGRGGIGTLITGNVMVDQRYLERPGNVVVEDESSMAQLAAWAEVSQRHGAVAIAQLSHPGRQCSRIVTRQPVAPSAVQLQLGGMFARPRALQEGEILDIIARYARAAAIMKRAGFRGVQVHAAHGYLCSEFLSPRVNQREDGWGGSLENRARFVREIVRAVRTAVGPDYPVMIKLNSSDFQQGAFDLDDSCRVAQWLEADGVDLIEVSGGTFERFRLLGLDQPEVSEARGTQRREAYFLEYAAAIRSAVHIPLAVTGGFRTPAGMRSALAQGLLDVVGLARPLCVEPDLGLRLSSGSEEPAPCHERSLRLGPGFMGPSSPSAAVRGFNAQAQASWYYAQILRLAAAEPPLLDLSPRSTLWRHYKRELSITRARRNARA